MVQSAMISCWLESPVLFADHEFLPLLIDRSHAEFKQTGLRVASVIRLHKPATVENRILVRRLGQIGPQLQAEVDVSLRKVLAL